MTFNWHVFLTTLFLSFGVAGMLTSLGFVIAEESPLFLLGLIPSIICMAAGFAFVP
jgi:hypothetical protein